MKVFMDLAGPKNERARIRISGRRSGLAAVQMLAHLVHGFAHVFDSLAGDVLALQGHDDTADMARNGLISFG